MAQKAQVIDVTKSYVPGDPNAFPGNLVNTSQEDGEEKTPAIMPFEGYNFLPTPYGYRSYFGTSSRLDVPTVPSRVQFILSYQSDTYINNLIALCEDGIWVIDPTANTNTWKHVVTHTFDSNVFEEWTYCIIENIVYMYKQGKSAVYHTSNTDDVPNGLSISILSFTPSFLNMAGQMGIFRAGTRLGFWDSANSISWSSNLNLQDFTPSLENLAGNTIFGLVTGRVVHVREQGEGFVVYSTKSIVGVSFSSESNMLWDSHLISDVCGIAYGREVCFGVSNNEHYVHSTIGMHRVGSYNGLTKVHEFTPVATELSDVLAEERDPIYLDCISGRYLYIHSINDTYINGKVSFTSVTVDDLNVDLVFNIEPTTVSKELFVKMVQNLEMNTADDTYAATLTKYTADGVPFDLIEWDVSYRAISPLGMYEKLQVPALGSTFSYQSGSTLNRTSIGWSDRTPIEGIFTPVSGDYNSLDSGVILPTYEEFMVRGNKDNSDFQDSISKVLRFQTDAFTHEDNKRTYDLSYQLRKGCGTEPSYLDIDDRISHGLIGGMYNIASHWKDYEKRQKLVIDNFSQIVSNLKPFNWNAYSVNGGLEAVIENPVYEIFDLFKPYGNTGIAPVGKGLFFYKNYREYYDCVLGAFREADKITHKEVDNNTFAGSLPAILQDSMEISVEVPGSSTTSFPNPGNYPLTTQVSTYNPGITYKPSGTSGDYGYNGIIFYSIVDTYGNESGKAYINNLVDETIYTLSANRNLPVGYKYRIYNFYTYLDVLNTYDNVVFEDSKYSDVDIRVGTPFIINSLGDFTNDASAFPLSIVNQSGNSLVPAVNTSGMSVAFIGTGSLAITVNIALHKTGGISEARGPMTYLASGSIDVYDSGFYITVPSPPTGYMYAVEVVQNHTKIKGTGIMNITTAGTHRFNIDDWNYSDYPIDKSYNWWWQNPYAWVAESSGGGSQTVTTTIPLRAGSKAFIENVITESLSTGIDFGSDVVLEFKPIINQLYSSPYSTEGTLPLLMQPFGGSDNYQATCTIHHKVSVTNDWNLESPVDTAYKVERFTSDLANQYPFSVQPIGGVGVIGTYRSHNEAYVRLAGYGGYMHSIMGMASGPNGDKSYQLSSSPSDYYSIPNGDKIEIWTEIYNSQSGQYEQAVVLLMEQTAGFIYQYDVEEEPFGSIVDDQKVDLGGSSLVPTLDTEGVYNTVGAFFMPKNKISSTLSNGVLTLGAVTAINEYTTKEAEILDFLSPSNGTFEVNKYLLPPTYDSGERWYLVKAADKIYDSGGVFDYKIGKVANIDNLFWNTPYYLPDFVPYDIPTDDITVIQESLGIIPGSTFLIQQGNISASYPTFKGAHVFDLFLKKWGKVKEDYKIIFPYNALNSGNSGILPYSNFGMDCGVVLASDSKISLFDIKPADSWMRIGKIGYYRLGMTRAYEVKTMFRSPSSGKITLDTSLDGRTLEVALKTEQIFNNKVKVDMYPDISGRWHTIKIEGNYDLQYLEFRGTISGRR